MNRTIILGAALLLIGMYMLSKPSCTDGCRTVAQAIVDHGLTDLLG